MSDPTMSYFVKEVVSNPLRLPSGRRVPWEDVGDDTGVLATNDSGLIEQLQQAIRRRVGGVKQVDFAGFEAAKKNSAAEQLRKLSLFRANNHNKGPRLAGQSVAAAVGPKLPSKQTNQPFVSPAGQPISTPSTLPIPKPVSMRRSAVGSNSPPSPPEAK